MEIFVYKGEYGLPSIDFDCLRALAYIKLSGAPVKINAAANPFNSKNGFLPYLVEGNNIYSGYDKIIHHLRTAKNYSLNSNDAYISYLRDNLYPFFMYQMWGNPQNIDTIRSLYAKRIPFPFNFYYPSKYIMKTNQVCETVASFSLEDPIENHETTDMSIRAKKCLNWISEKLANNEYFLDGTPTELDVTLYAYLALITKETLPSNILNGHAQACTNLQEYVDRFTKKLFNESELFISPEQKEGEQKKQQKSFNGEEEEEPKNVVRKRYLLSGLFAATAMMSYALFTGIFSIARAQDNNEQFTFDELVDDED
ncbi:unnamed protein product [Diamesa hyperborea]